MAKIVRYNGNLVPFASASLGTERTLFGEVTQADDITSQYTADFLRGWGIVGPSDQPALQDFNAVSYAHGQILSYLHQMGVAEYNAAQEYHIGSVTQVSGSIYISLINTNVGNAPASSPAAWKNPVTEDTLGRLIGVQVFSTAGSFVYTPTSGTTSVVVEVQGGGGAGGGTAVTGAGQVAVGGGGGGGAYSRSRLTSGFSGVTVTVGAGGAGVVSAPGGNGVASSFGVGITAPGGGGGSGGAALATPPNVTGGGGSGVATGGNIVNSSGGNGNVSLALSVGSVLNGGAGGSSYFGGGALNSAGNAFGNNAVSPGSGGSGVAMGQSQAAVSGGNGKAGIVIVWEYK